MHEASMYFCTDKNKRLLYTDTHNQCTCMAPDSSELVNKDPMQHNKVEDFM